MQKFDSFKINFIWVLIITIPLIIISYFFVYETLTQRKAAEIAKNITITRSSARYIEHEIDDEKMALEKMVLDKNFMKLDAGYINGILQFYKTDNHRNYFVADPRGNVIAHTYSKKQIPNISGTKYFARAMRGKTFFTGQYRLPFDDQFLFTLFVPVKDDAGRVVGVIGSNIPITTFNEFIDSVKLGKSGRLSLLDSEGNYIYDQKVDNINKFVHAGCFDHGVGQEINVTERKSVKTGKSTVFTKVKLNTLNWYLVALQPSSDIYGPGIAMVTKNLITLILLILTIVILWRYKALLLNRDLLIQTQNADKLALVGELAAGMAHEIRNPLTTIKGFTELLRNKEKYQEDREVLDLLRNSVDHIEGIIRETLLLAKPQKMVMKSIDLGRLVEETHTLMNNQALLRETNFDCYTSREPVFVTGDELHLKQVLINLVKNSLEATGKGDRVRISLTKTDRSTAVITVEDTGVGIKSGDVSRIGRPFFTTKANGTGLGLSVCRRIVGEHGGTLDIKSKAGRGTTVRISLPMQNVKADYHIKANGNISAGDERSGSAPAGTIA